MKDPDLLPPPPEQQPKTVPSRIKALGRSVSASIRKATLLPVPLLFVPLAVLVFSFIASQLSVSYPQPSYTGGQWKYFLYLLRRSFSVSLTSVGSGLIQLMFAIVCMLVLAAIIRVRHPNEFEKHLLHIVVYGIVSVVISFVPFELYFLCQEAYKLQLVTEPPIFTISNPPAPTFEIPRPLPPPPPPPPIHFVIPPESINGFRQELAMPISCAQATVNPSMPAAMREKFVSVPIPVKVYITALWSSDKSSLEQLINGVTALSPSCSPSGFIPAKRLDVSIKQLVLVTSERSRLVPSTDAMVVHWTSEKENARLGPSVFSVIAKYFIASSASDLLPEMKDEKGYGVGVFWIEAGKGNIWRESAWGI